MALKRPEKLKIKKKPTTISSKCFDEVVRTRVISEGVKLKMMSFVGRLYGQDEA